MPDFWIDHNATGDDSGDSWANAFPDVATYIADAGSAVGDEVWVASDHLEQTAAAVTLTFYDKSVLTSVNTSTDVYQAGARIETSSTSNISLACSNADGGIAAINGVYFNSKNDVKFTTFGSKWMLNECKLELLGTAADLITATLDGVNIIFNNGELKFNGTAQDFSISSGCKFSADNLTITVPAGTDHFFDVGTNGGACIVITNSDLSATTLIDVLIEQQSDIDDTVHVLMSRVLVGSGYDIISDTIRSNRYVELYSVGTADEYYNLGGSYREGDIELSTTVVRNATYYSTSKFSLKYLPSSNVIEFVNPLRYQLKAPVLDLSAGAKTLTVHIHLQDSVGTPDSLTDKNTKLVAHYADGTNLALGLTVTSNPTIDVLDSSTPLSTVTADFTGAGLSGTYKQHTISLIIPQNTATGMDKAICELWLEVSETLAGTTEMFVCPDPTVT